jgi:3-oxoacyl-[acyl-carrier protein] reductase
MTRKLEGQVALVSGSGRGIGREIALKLASEGARVVINDLDQAPAEQTVADIVASGGQAVACIGSVTDTDFGERFVKTALDAFGGIDIIVNNAGYTWDNVLQKMSDEQWEAMLAVHLTAPFRILRAASNFIRDAAKKEAEAGISKHRKVVNISSTSGVYGNAGQANYAAAKEWGRYKVNVNSVAFGLIMTRLTQPLTAGDASVDIQGRTIAVGVQPDRLKAAEATIPLGRGGTPEEAAGAVYMFCIPESNYVSGQVLVCGGGRP